MATVSEALNVFLILHIVLNVVVAIPEANFYPFGEAAGDESLPRVLDNSSPAVPLTSARFAYFGQFHDQLFVNSNGHITFFAASNSFVPQQFPLPNNLQLIAPFWADSDTSNPESGLVWFRIAIDSVSIQRAIMDISRAFPSQQSFRPAWLLIATWDHVGVYPRLADVRNTFQCVLATDGETSFVLFLYADNGIEWLWSQDHIGVPGQVGFNAGDGVRYFSHPDSFTTRLMNIWNTTNTGVPGVWVFKVDGEEIIPAGCSNQQNVPLSLTPRYGHLFGATPVIVTGPCFSPSTRVTCFFGESLSRGIVISEDQCLCVSPVLTKVGEINFRLRIGPRSGGNIFQSRFYTISPDRADVIDISASSLFFDTKNSTEVLIQWNSNDILPTYLPKNLTHSTDINVDLYVQQYNSDMPEWKFETTVIREQPIEAGEARITIPTLTKNIECRVPIHSSIGSVDAGLCPVIFKAYVTIQRLQVGGWSGVNFIKSNTQPQLSSVCHKWRNAEMSSGVSGDSLLEEVLPCPPTEVLAQNDRNYEKEEMASIFRRTSFSQKFMNLFHPGIKICYRQSVATSTGLGQQCCYREDGNLAKGQPSGGSVDIMSPNFDYNRHLSDDIIPYLYCCQAEAGSTMCNEYFNWRPSGEETDYILPIPACIYGDPHIVTLDGLKYTFNGKGEFTMIETTDSSFTLQGRMDTILDPNNRPTPGTVFTSLVARQHNTNTTVQFDIRINGLRVRLDGTVVNFDDLDHVITDFVTLTDNGNNSVSAFFKEGVKMELKVQNRIISVMLVTLPSSLKGKTRGLMGNYNGNMNDDLIPRFETIPLPTNSSLEDIHNSFGVSWILNSANESFFSYSPGESFSTFYNLTYLPIFEAKFENETLEQQARKVCGDDTFCLFDVAATKNVVIGLATMEGGKEFEDIVEMAVPIICDPSCVNGACVINNTCSCNEGFEGISCEVKVVSECDVNLCQNNGTCTKHVLSYTCDCPNGFIGAFCQEKEPPFQIHLLNSSPRVSGNTLFVDFETSVPASFSRCHLTGGRQFKRQSQCNAGRVRFRNVPPGSYIFRVQSFSTQGEKAVVRRIVHVGETGEEDFCAIHLINEGVAINGRSVSIQFQGTTAVVSYRCRLSGNSTITGFSPCRSPIRYQDLEVGEYRFQVDPIGCGKGRRLSTKFQI